MSHKTLFDHRLRLEKEYGLYSDLWDKLFKLRRAIRMLVNLDYRHDGQTPGLFNDYQEAVLKGEPFMCPSVLDPAREIETLARKIIEDDKERADHEALREREKHETKIVQLRKANRVAFNEIEKRSQTMKKAIRRRVSA